MWSQPSAKDSYVSAEHLIPFLEYVKPITQISHLWPSCPFGSAQRSPSMAQQPHAALGSWTGTGLESTHHTGYKARHFPERTALATWGGNGRVSPWLVPSDTSCHQPWQRGGSSSGHAGRCEVVHAAAVTGLMVLTGFEPGSVPITASCWNEPCWRMRSDGGSQVHLPGPTPYSHSKSHLLNTHLKKPWPWSPMGLGCPNAIQLPGERPTQMLVQQQLLLCCGASNCPACSVTEEPGAPLQHTSVHCALLLTFSALDSAGVWNLSFFWTPFWNPFLSPLQRRGHEMLCPLRLLHLAVTHQVILPWVGFGEWLKRRGQGQQQKWKK